MRGNWKKPHPSSFQTFHKLVYCAIWNKQIVVADNHVDVAMFHSVIPCQVPRMCVSSGFCPWPSQHGDTQGLGFFSMSIYFDLSSISTRSKESFTLLSDCSSISVTCHIEAAVQITTSVFEVFWCCAFPSTECKSGIVTNGCWGASILFDVRTCSREAPVQFAFNPYCLHSAGLTGY